MTAIAIFFILAMIGLPSMRELINELSVSSATSEFMAAVRLARSEAIKRGQLVTICRSVSAESGNTVCSNSAHGSHGGKDWGAGWLVYVENSSSDSIGTYDAGEEVLLRQGALQRRINAADSTASRITFNGTGQPVGLGVFSINFNHDGKFMRQLCMARTGRMRVIRDAKEC